MAVTRSWRDKGTVALLVAGVISLCAGASISLILARVEALSLTLMLLGAVCVVVYVALDYANVSRALSGRQARYGGNTLAMILIFIAIVGVLNVFSTRYSYRLDLTEEQRFSISDQTTEVLKSLKDPVQIKAFFRPSDYGREGVQDLLKEYQRLSDKVQYEFIDWETRPADAIKYGLQMFPAVVVESGGRRQDLTSVDEAALTTGIFKVSEGEPKRVYFTAGHGEPDLAGTSEAGLAYVRQALESNNYKVDTINLASTSAISSEVSGIVIYAPKTAFLPEEKQVLTAYLDNGGKAMVLVAPGRSANLADILAPYGLQVGTGFAIDQKQALTRQPHVPVITSYPSSSPITSDLQRTGQAAIMPLSTQIGVAQQLPAGTVVDKLLQTTELSWLATNDQDLSYREGDVRGPLTVAVAVTADPKGGTQPPDAKTRLVVFGSADFASNFFLDALGNRQLFINAANWLTGAGEVGLSIHAQEVVDRTILLTGTQANLLLYSSVLFLPLAVAIAGGFVWWNRR